MLPGDMVLDGRPAPVLAGPHDSSSVWGSFPPHQQPGSHPQPGHQPMAPTQGALQLGVCGHERHVVD